MTNKVRDLTNENQNFRNAFDSCQSKQKLDSEKDGLISRAKKLIRLCAKAGADAAKFQHFKAETIISPLGFKEIGKKNKMKTGVIIVKMTGYVTLGCLQ